MYPKNRIDSSGGFKEIHPCFPSWLIHLSRKQTSKLTWLQKFNVLDENIKKLDVSVGCSINHDLIKKKKEGINYKQFKKS